MGLADVIKDTMDGALKDYLESEEYQRQADEIEQLEKKLKVSLTPAQKKLLMELLDKISYCDGKFAMEAYVTGVVRGIALRDQYVP